MAKKDKKYDAPEAPKQEAGHPENTEAQNAEAAAPAAQGNPQFVKKPGIFLQDADGVQYKFDRRELPKKAAVVGNILIDGVETPFQVTSNKGWTPEDKVIDYIWVSLGINEERVQGYITLDYLVPAASFVGKEFTRGEGNANRENPARVPKNVEGEALRKQRAAETIAAKKKAADDAAAAAATATDAQAQGETQPETEGQPS